MYLPTEARDRQGREDRIRLKNLLQQTQRRLAEGMRPVEAERLLAEANRIPEDREFWDSRGQGLAILISPNFFIRRRLPVELPELAVVHRRFYVRPLLPLLEGGERFLILTLSHRQVRLMAASADGLQSIHVPGMPNGMADALGYDGADRGSQVHSAANGRPGKQAAVFHGQGGKPDAHKDDLASYFRRANAALEPVLRRTTDPLLLAGVDYLFPIFRACSCYEHILKAQLPGNWDLAGDDDLHRSAREVAEPYLRRSRTEISERYSALATSGKVSGDLPCIVAAAHEGKIASLVLDARAERWGRYYPKSGETQLCDHRESGDDDLLDLAAAQTLLHRGQVYSVASDQVPGGEAAAAMFRY